MTNSARYQEAEEASVAFQIALTQIGAKTVEEALKLWESVPVEARASTATSWLRRAITLVMGRRRRSRDLARAYYRLVRALVTGSTVADPYHPEPEHVSLQDLREEFAELVGEAAQDAPEPEEQGEETAVSQPEPEPARAVESPSPEEDEDADLDRILVEEIEALRAEEERIEREAERELRVALAALGTDNLAKKVEAIGNDKPAKDVDAARKEAHEEAGARQAAAAERVAMNGARSTLWSHMNKDQKAIGYVRLSRTGTPCGWCAMLISRGPAYKSEKSATFADGDRYHDNCHCYAMPVFSREQWRESDLFAMSRRYSDEWPRVTKGLSGKAAVSAWRRYIRQQQKAEAQEARRRTTNVQEA
ncbi:hypothetical protein [Actinocorallia libanotica]|uniref:Capsid maturation protease n=1 Tax=Actinocorallia libanotica TaxID=46162 RepID=A0ABN1RXW0_9ACTN